MQKITQGLLSFLMGGILQMLAIAVFWFVFKGSAMRKETPPRQVLNRFYAAELLKWITVVLGFSGIWLWGKSDPLWVLVGFSIPQLIYWERLLSQKSEKLPLGRKTAA